MKPFYCILIAVFVLGLLANTLYAAPLEAGSYENTWQGLAGELRFDERCGFDLVLMEGGDSLTETGAPALPFVQLNVAIPSGARVLELQTNIEEGVEIVGAYDLLPNSEPIPISAAPASGVLWKDPAVYRMDRNYPGIDGELAGTWDLAGQDFVTIHLYPLQYNPVSRKIRMATELRYRVVYETGPSASRKTYNFSATVRNEMLERLRSLAVNPSAIGPLPDYLPGASSLAAENHDYVIITAADFVPEFQELADWRTERGLHAKIVDIAWIYSIFNGASDEERIRNFVREAHTHWGALYFLIGGDTAIIPRHTRTINSTNIPNDTYYADFDSDWKYEVYLGRACVNNAAEIQTFVQKVLTYEKTPPADYGDTVFFMGFDLDNSTHGENCKTKIRDTMLPAGMIFAQEFDSESGAHKPDVKACLSQGFNLVNHIDHCNTGILGVGSVHHNTSLTKSEARAFTNGTRYSNFYTLGCYAGNYAKTCWGEAFVNDDQGGITFVGNSRNGFYHKGNTNTLSHKYDQKWWQALCEENAYRAGEALAVSLNLFKPTTSTYKYIFTELNLFGDPALHIWMRDPTPMTVIHADKIGLGSSYFPVRVLDDSDPLEGALVCAMQKGYCHGAGLTGPDGRVKLAIHPTAFTDMTLTVTAQDRTVYQTQVEVVSHFPYDPHITAVSPRYGPDLGGTNIAITGRYFVDDPHTKITIGSKPCTDIEIVSPRKITCVTPQGVEGYKDIRFENCFGRDELHDAFFYFPTNADPFNDTDKDTSAIRIPYDEDLDKPITVIASGAASSPFIVFYSLGGGPLNTPFGQAGLSAPLRALYAGTLNADGYTLLPIKLPPDWEGEFDLYLQILSLDASGSPKWAQGGNNPNRLGSIWLHFID